MKTAFTVCRIAISLIASTPTAATDQLACHLSDPNCTAVRLTSQLKNAVEYNDQQLIPLLTTTLIKLADEEKTVEAFRNAKGLALTSRLAFIIGEINSPEGTKLMRRLATAELDLQSFFANKYLAARGEREALSRLNQNYYQYAIPSFAWSEAVWVFGEQKYKPATCNLVGSLNAAYLGLAQQAAIALKAMYPERFQKLDKNSPLTEWQTQGATLCPPSG